MTTEAPTTNPSSSEERMARIEAQQEIIIDLLRDHNTKFDRIDERFDMLDQKFDARIDGVNARIDATNTRIDAVNQRLFFAGLALFTIVGTGVATYIVNLIV